MEAARGGVDLPLPGPEAIRVVNERLRRLGWDLHFTEELRTKEDRPVAFAFGTTEPFGGASVFSFLARGAASVAFLVRVEERSASACHVEILAGGTEGWAGFDFGRNRGVVKAFLEGLRPA